MCLLLLVFYAREGGGVILCVVEVIWNELRMNN